MTATWTTQISESKWKRVRRELEDNGLILAFSQGVTLNDKTNYRLISYYDRDKSQLGLRISYPGDHRPEELKCLEACLCRLFDSPTLQLNGNGGYR